MEDWTYGETAKDPVATSSTNGTNNVTYKYKVSTAADSTYTDAKPSNAGTYTVQATFAETDNYNEVTTTANFTIEWRNKWRRSRIYRSIRNRSKRNISTWKL